MRLRRNPLSLLGLLLLASAPVQAAPPAPSPPPAAAPGAIPDYGGRESAPLAAGEAAAPNPAAQAGRALGALVLVLAGAAGVVFLLKRFGLVQAGADGKPARINFAGANFAGLGRPVSAALRSAPGVTVESSQALPGGAMLHVVSVPGRTVLLAATAHTVSAVAEWPASEEDAPTAGGDEADAFEAYLARAETPESGIAAANQRLRSLLSRPQPKDQP